MFLIIFVHHHTFSHNSFTFLFNFMTFSDVDASLVEYECFVPIVFATLDDSGTGMIGSVSQHSSLL